ncbi:perlucin-like [Ylistrum balloti]|uniref:perlucin-like n=1 Tax=Ylistrum balloti TaxID=509963 RepID=UPI0029059DF5|nr:perlucin-like [Ylistrum balloti]
MSGWIHATLLLLLVVKAQGCPLGWVQGPINCFFFSQFPGTWADANAICRSFNAKLAEPEEAITLTFLIGHAKSEHAFHDQFYLGGSDMFVEGVWEWSSTKHKINPGHWLPGNPNDDGHNGDCLTLQGSQGGLNDVICTSDYSFICETE